MFRKTLEDQELLPHNIVHEKKKFTFRLTEDQKVTLDIQTHNIAKYNYLDENFSKSKFQSSFLFNLS